jgi:cellulose synthase/poly-beta-1,6-N-acetylglucosamine synthase-like glycosyltransferase
LAPTLSRLAEPQRWPIYTILCPLYREANVAPDLVAALAALDYPVHALDVKLLVEGDDVDTLAAALAVSAAPHIEVVIVPPAAPRTKPKALNVGLARARGQFVVVYDAEDRPHPQQLRAALAAFEDGAEKLACVQAPLVIDNADASWIARQFAAEYAIQFREVLPLLARLRAPLALGGSSNHFRTDALRAVGGWDSHNVTEDADLGYRFARDGYRIEVIGPPTYEEAPVAFTTWLNQRTRWIKGHMQTWLVLMRDPVRTAREMGPAAFAVTHLMLSGGLAAAFLHGPIACIIVIAALSPYTLLTPADFVLAICGYSVAIFAALTASALSNSLMRPELGDPRHQPVAGEGHAGGDGNLGVGLLVADVLGAARDVLQADRHGLVDLQPGRGQLHRTVLALEQGRAEKTLENPDLPADRRLGDRELPRRGGEAAVAGGRLEHHEAVRRRQAVAQSSHQIS